MSSMLRAALRAWYAVRLLGLRAHRRPRDPAVIRSGDPRADRVLVIGNGITHGWGVDSHREALIGRLAHAVADRTGRGCDVELVGAETMNAQSARAWVGERDLTGFDAVVVALGLNDALRRTPVADWAQGMSGLLADVVPRLRPEATALVLGIPPTRALPVFDGIAARLAEGYRGRLDDAAAYAAELEGVGHLAIPELRTDERGRLTAPSLAAQLAARLAPELATALVRSRPDAAPRDPEPDARWDWTGAERVLEIARSGGAPVLRELAETAQRAFKVERAAVSVVNGDRLLDTTAADVLSGSVPLDLSFCRHTVADGRPVVVPDARADTRFAGNPHLDVAGIAFYAGYPLRASDGRVIGSFALQGSRARAAGAVSMDALRGFALRAEAELRRLAAATS